MHGLMRVRGFTQDDAACVLYRAAARRGMSDDQRSDLVDLRGISALPANSRSSSRPVPKNASATDEMWDHAERVMATVLAEIAAKSHNQSIKTAIQSRRRRVLRPKFEYVLRDAHRPRLASAAPPERHGRTSTCRKDSAPSISMPTARKSRRSWCTGRSAARWSATSAS